MAIIHCIAHARASNVQGRMLALDENSDEANSYDNGFFTVADPVSPNGDATRGSPIPIFAEMLHVHFGVLSDWSNHGEGSASLTGTHIDAGLSSDKLINMRSRLGILAAAHPNDKCYRYLFLGTSSADWIVANDYTKNQVRDAFQTVIDFAMHHSSWYTPLGEERSQPLSVIIQGPESAQTPTEDDWTRAQTVVWAAYNEVIARNIKNPYVYNAGNPMAQHGRLYGHLATDATHKAKGALRSSARFLSKNLGPLLAARA